MRVLLLRPPRFVWPFNSETSAFWQPLAFACLAASARREIHDLDVHILDCPAQHIGWKTLTRRLIDEPIDVLGLGEETVSAHEALRAASIVRKHQPGCLIVAGGSYFAYAIEQTLASGLVDVIVRGEGERTFVELLEAYSGNPSGPLRLSLAGDRIVRGIAFRDATGRIVLTPPRPLIDHMDDLPLPAYDLLDMDRYGRRSRNHPALVSIEHSRGCIDACSFCVLWRHMGEYRDHGSPNRDQETLPKYRTKSGARSFDEVLELYRRFDRRTFGWVDPTFNASADWSDAFADRVLASELMDARGRSRTLHTAWVRADCLVRDHKLGVLPKLVRAGLRQVMIGVERDDPAGLAYLNKHHNEHETVSEAFAILRENYPEVYTIGTMIFGLPGDTRADIDRLIQRQYELGMDYCFLMPLTPNPGTRVRDDALSAGRLANPDLASYNFHTPVLRTDRMTLGDLEASYYRLMLRPSRGRLKRMVRQMVLERDRRKRRVHWALLMRGTGIAIRALARRLLRPGATPTLYSHRPKWYDS